MVLLNKEKISAIKNIRGFTASLAEQTVPDASTLFNALLHGAIALEASDIHIEPLAEQAMVRMRLDGILQDAGVLSKETFTVLLSRIKLTSGLKLNVEDRPQDGRFSFTQTESLPIEVRTSTLPAEYGESVVLRILNPKNLLSLKDLGLREDLRLIFEKEIQKPHGMIIVTGPTGSGKTTTLYAFLKEVASRQEKTITIEDPIEYHIKGVSQTQVNPAKGYTFASGLKAIMRQDPDVILVGEIRDSQTAEIALQAALTGHLVFSTLHTNDAAGTIARLTALGAQMPTVASALTLVVAQRLLRKVCLQCTKLQKPTKQELQTIQKYLKSLKTRTKIKIGKIPSTTKGCEECNFTGFKGRIGIFEALLVSDDMEQFLLRSPSSVALKEFAVKKGMTTLYQDGLVKVIQGITTLQELQRVAAQ